jgi:hypothetical protein
MEKRAGGCLCGAVRFSATPSAHDFEVCHCGMCRRWSGGAFMAVACDDLDIAEGAPLGVYRASSYAERVFCSRCGSSLFWRMQDGGASWVALQAFDAVEDFAFASEIFIDEKPANYAFANETQKLTGAEFFARYMPEQESAGG